MTTTPPGEPELAHRLLALAMDVAREAGRLIVEDRPRGMGVADTKTTATDIVTVMDRRSERLIVERIAAARPDDGFLGEEGSEREGSSGVSWVVDPIDGTVNYLYEIPAYAVSIAAAVGGEVVAGVVVNPVLGETWTALRGEGAWLDGRRLEAVGPPPLELALVATGFGYDARRRTRQAEILQAVLPRVRDVRRFGAASLDLCAVAAGRVDAFYEQGLMPWDLAAGGLVAAEAGASVTGLHGRPAGEAFVMAARPPLAGLLLALLEGLDADSDPLERAEH
ncbi:MAG TPA: inositol monophosphatase family protein [Actinomycetes bacterium]|nr:inositol monophosphatase family protein [Actinomycetes bacterium]